MSTRAHIVVQLSDRQFRASFVENDGYGLDNILNKHYSDFDKAEALIRIGDMSSLGESLITCDVYRKQKEPKLYEFWHEYLAEAVGNINIEYAYLWLKDSNEWKKFHISALRYPQRYDGKDYEETDGEKDWDDDSEGLHFDGKEMKVLYSALESLIYTCNTIRRGKKTIVETANNILEKLDEYEAE